MLTAEPQAGPAAGGEPSGSPPVPAPDRRLARRLFVASAGGVVGAAACYLLMVRTTIGQRFDWAASFGASRSNPRVQADSSDLLQRITADSFAVVLAIIVIIGLVRRRPWLGLGAALAAGVAVVGTDILKDHVLTTPDLVMLGHVNSFPSGHTATAVSCAMALVLVSPPRWKAAAAVGAGAYGWITAAQVQTAGWHKTSDAMGAACLAFASVTFIAGVMAWLFPVQDHTRPEGTQVDRDYFASQVVLATVALVAAFVSGWGLAYSLAVLRHQPDVRQAGSVFHSAYLGGLAMTITLVVVLLMTLLALLGDSDLDVPTGLRGARFFRRPALDRRRQETPNHR